MRVRALCLAALLAAPAGADPVGVPFDDDYEPLSYLAEGEPQGFDIELAKAMAAEAGIEISFAATDFNRLQHGDWAEGWGFAVASMSRNPDREERFHFVGPYYYDTVVLVAADDGAEGFEPPGAGARIGVCRGCIYKWAILGGHVGLDPSGTLSGSEVEIVEFVTDTDALRQLGALGDDAIDYAVTSAHVAERFVDAGFGVEMSDYQLFMTPVWIVVPKADDAMLATVEAAFAALRDSGRIEPLWDRHLKRDYINPAVILSPGR